MASNISVPKSGGSTPYRPTEASDRAPTVPPSEAGTPGTPVSGFDDESEEPIALKSILTPGQSQAAPLRSEVELHPNGRLGGPLIACPPAPNFWDAVVPKQK